MYHFLQIYNNIKIKTRTSGASFIVLLLKLLVDRLYRSKNIENVAVPNGTATCFLK